MDNQLIPTWYLVGAGLWMFATGFNYALWRTKWTARAFLASPVWPVALVVATTAGFMMIWKSAAVRPPRNSGA